MDVYAKVYKFVRIVPLIGVQGIVFQLYINGFTLALLKRDPLYWLSITLYFLFLPVIFGMIIMTLKICCRSKHLHPLGNQLSDRYFKLLERSRNMMMLVLIYFFTLLLAYFELYIQGIQDIKIRGSYKLLPFASILFTGLFVSVAVIICCASKYFRYLKSNLRKYLACKLEEFIRDQIMIARIAEIRQEAATARQQAQMPALPIVDYLEDSKLSIDYFKMKNSVYFSIIEKNNKNSHHLNVSPKAANDKIGNEDKVKMFNMSAINQDEFILSSICVWLYFKCSTIQR